MLYGHKSVWDTINIWYTCQRSFNEWLLTWYNIPRTSCKISAYWWSMNNARMQPDSASFDAMLSISTIYKSDLNTLRPPKNFHVILSLSTYLPTYLSQFLLWLSSEFPHTGFDDNRLAQTINFKCIYWSLTRTPDKKQFGKKYYPLNVYENVNT